MMKKIKGKKPRDLLKHYKRMAHDNIKDIIACGFILEKTFIFQDGLAMGGAFYDNVVLMSKTLTLSKIQGVFGFGES
jgi:tryptophanyl-tRNA synthetase